MSPLTEDAHASETFVFGNATMKWMVVVYTLIAPAASMACIYMAWVALSDWWLFLVAFGLALIVLLAVQQARQYRSTLGRKMRVDAVGISLPELDILLPWNSIKRISQRRDRRRSGGWRYIEFYPGSRNKALLAKFAEFNCNVPSALGPFAVHSAGVVVDMLNDPARDHPRLIATIHRFAPDLIRPER